MKNKIIIIPTIIAFIAIFTSCEKDSITLNSINPIPTKRTSVLGELFKNLAPPMQSFTRTAGQNFTITGEKGTKITFNGCSFMNKSGQVINSGQVTIKLQEMLTGPEMILANKTTTSNGQLLQSGGQVFVSAFQNGAELAVNPNCRPFVQISTSSSATNMKVFMGSVKEKDSIAGDTSIDWSVKDKDTVAIIQDTIATGGTTSYFSFYISEFRYINCDAFYNYTEPKTDIKVVTPIEFKDTNCTVYIYFLPINSVTSLFSLRHSNEFEYNTQLAPVGMAIKAVMVGRKGGKYYYEIKSTNVTNGIVINLSTPSEATLDQIKLAIKNL